jgi:hypothetical protein
MIDVTDPTAGQGWARLGLGFGVALSITGNVAATALTDSSVSLGLRIPFAIVWPLALFFAVEILVRVRWMRTFLHVLGRIVLIGPVSAVAAIVSWLHLNHLMGMAGEVSVARVLGPLAVDGLMLGSTVALLAIRAIRAAREDALPATAAVPAPATLPEIPELPPIRETTEIEQRAADMLNITLTNPRKPRAAKADQEKAVRLMLEGKADEAVEAGLMGASTMRRYAKVRRMLAAGQIEVDPVREKVNPELVALIRASITDGVA